MRFGMSAAAIIVEKCQVLLVHHQFDDGEDFWVPPGGSVEGSESIMDCAVREVFEETNLRVEPSRVVYIEDLIGSDHRFCKFYVLCNKIAGSLSLKNLPEEHVTDVKFMSRDEIEGLTVFPAILSGQFWQDMDDGFNLTRYLGVTRL